MIKLQDDILYKRITSKYPTPIAQTCRNLFECSEDISPESIDEIFDSIWFFAGSVAAAKYLATGAPSLKINLFLMSSIRFINCERWIKAFELMLPEFTRNEFMLPFLELYRATYAVSESPVEKYYSFRKRVKNTGIPADPAEILKIRQDIIQLLESISFLKNYTLISCDETGTFNLKGVEKQSIEKQPELTPGQVMLINMETGEGLSLYPFIKPSDNKSGIEYTDFRQDQNAYREIIKNPFFLKDIKEYQNLLAARPVFEKSEQNGTLHVSFDDLKIPVEKALTDPDVRRILIEAPPGGGKTLLTSNFRNIFNKPGLHISDYYLEDDHLTTSIVIFSRFFYFTLNDCIETKHEFSGGKEEWKVFRDKVSRDFQKSGKQLVFVIDSMKPALSPFTGEKISIEQFLNMEIPNNIKIIMTTCPGIYPSSFDLRIPIMPLSIEQLNSYTGSEKSGEEKLGLWEFYGGQRGYINQAFQETYDPLKIPDSIARKFNELLFKYNYFNPVKRQIFRYLSGTKDMVTLQKMSMDMEISGFEILNLLSEIWPLIRFERKEDIVRYSLFIPAFAEFIQSYDK
jgi:hypothetical protein